MKKNSYLNCILFLLMLLSTTTRLQAQTSQWRLIWDKNLEQNLDYYVIYRAEQPGASVPIDSVNHTARIGDDTTMTYIDSTLSRGVRYYYRIKAVDSLKLSSDFSDEVDAAIPLLSLPGDIYIESGQSKSMNWYPFVNDPDNPDTSLTMVLSGNKTVQLDTSNLNTTGEFIITAPEGSEGLDHLTFEVFDPDSFYDRAQSVIHILPVNSTQVEWSNVQIKVAEDCEQVNISWDTNVATKDTILFGTSTAYGNESTSDKDFVSQHMVTLGNLEQGLVYHFKVRSRDENGISFTSNDSTFETCILSSEINVYPIPYRVNHPEDGDGIHFDNLPQGSSLLIFNLLGDPVFKTNDLNGDFIWDIKNNKNKQIHTGVYLYVIKNSRGKELVSDKIMIIR